MKLRKVKSGYAALATINTTDPHLYEAVQQKLFSLGFKWAGTYNNKADDKPRTIIIGLNGQDTNLLFSYDTSYNAEIKLQIPRDWSIIESTIEKLKADEKVNIASVEFYMEEGFDSLRIGNDGRGYFSFNRSQMDDIIKALTSFKKT